MSEPSAEERLWVKRAELAQLTVDLAAKARADRDDAVMILTGVYGMGTRQVARLLAISPASVTRIIKANGGEPATLTPTDAARYERPDSSEREAPDAGGH